MFQKTEESFSQQGCAILMTTWQPATSSRLRTFLPKKTTEMEDWQQNGNMLRLLAELSSLKMAFNKKKLPKKQSQCGRLESCDATPNVAYIYIHRCSICRGRPAHCRPTALVRRILNQALCLLLAELQQLLPTVEKFTSYSLPIWKEKKK